MGQLTEQFIRVRAKPFIVEVDQQTSKIEENMFVTFFHSNIHLLVILFSAKRMKQR